MELIVSNVIDAYRDNVALIEDPALKRHEIMDSYYIEDRSLLWGGKDKVVVTSMPIEPAHLAYLQKVMGYGKFVNLYPQKPSDALCEDILREPELRRQIVAQCRGAGRLPLIAFVSSRKVCDVGDALRREGLDIFTPECPPADLLWLRDKLDEKAGFRRFFATIADQVPGVRLPAGKVVKNTAEAAQTMVEFLNQGRPCLAKPNVSQSGVGFLILHPGEASDAAAIKARLDTNPQMTAGLMVVEELIDMDKGLGGGSPSIEMRVPGDPRRDVEFMYLCGQILTPEGYFFGVEMYHDLVAAQVQRTIEAAGVAVARQVRQLGYVGVFDMDLVAGKDGRLYAVEINTRRTGGTHAHEAALALYGPRYWERAAVISNNVLTFSGPRLDYPGFVALIGGDLFPIAGKKEGILPTIVSSLPDNRFGYISFAPTIERAREIERGMLDRLAASGRPLAGM
jgi:hypothetical protein